MGGCPQRGTCCCSAPCRPAHVSSVTCRPAHCQAVFFRRSGRGGRPGPLSSVTPLRRSWGPRASGQAGLKPPWAPSPTSVGALGVKGELNSVVGKRGRGPLAQGPRRVSPAPGRAEKPPCPERPAELGRSRPGPRTHMPDCSLLLSLLPPPLTPLPSRPPMLLLPSPLSPTVSSKLKWPSPPRTAVPLRASVCPSLTPFSAGTAPCLCPR